MLNRISGTTFAPARFSALNPPKCICGAGSAPDPTEGAYTTPTVPLTGFDEEKKRERGKEVTGEAVRKGRKEKRREDTPEVNF